MIEPHFHRSIINIIGFFFIAFIVIAPGIDNFLFTNFDIQNNSSTRVNTVPIFSIITMLLPALALLLSQKVKIKREDFFWLSLIFIFHISNLFSQNSFENKVYIGLLLTFSPIAALAFSNNQFDAHKYLKQFVYLITFVALTLFLWKFAQSGKLNIARGGLNAYTFSGIIVSLLILLIVNQKLFNNTQASKKNLLNTTSIITLISFITANRMGVLISLVLWLYYFIKYKPQLLIIVPVLLSYLFVIFFDFLSTVYIFQRFGIYDFSIDFLVRIFLGSRGQIWEDAFLHLLNPQISLMGVGIGSFHILEVIGVHLDSAHNFYLTQVIEFGILIGSLVCILFYKTINHSLQPQKSINLILFLFLFISGGFQFIQSVGMLNAHGLFIIILASRAITNEV